MDKTQLRKTLCEQAATVAAAVFSFAAASNNNQLKEEVNYPISELTRQRDEMLVPICNNISAAATANIASLTTYGVTATTTGDLEDAIEDYAAIVALPRNAVTQRSAYTEAIRNLFKEADAIVKLQMDKLALQFKTANLQFYNTYKNNRIILDAATSTTQATGLITDSVTNQPIASVAIQVVNQPYTATGNSTGGYAIKIPVPGTYSITFTIGGYNTKTVTGVVITLGQSTTLNVQLVPLPV